MKRLIILMAMILLLIPVNIWAQLDIFGQAGAGFFHQDGLLKVGVFAGGDLQVSHDTAKGVTIFTRVQVLYSKFDGSYQAGAAFLMTQKRLGLWRDLYIGFGPGYYYRVKGEAQDEQNMALRLNVGTDFLRGLGIDFGADYIPSIPVADGEETATTRWFFYGAINLYPRL